MDNNNNNTELTDAIYRARVSRGLSQTDLAALAGVSHSTISRLERGCVSTNRQTIAAVMNSLNMKAVYIVGIADTTSHQVSRQGGSGARGSGPTPSRPSAARHMRREEQSND